MLVSTNAGDITSTLQVGTHCTSDSALTYYGDELIASAGPSESPRPSGVKLGSWREEGDDILFNRGHAADRNLVVVGQGLLSSVSVGTDTMEIDGTQLQRLYAYAASLWFQSDIDQINDSDLNAAQRRWRHFQNRIEDGFGSMMPIPVYKTAVGA